MLILVSLQIADKGLVQEGLFSSMLVQTRGTSIPFRREGRVYKGSIMQGAGHVLQQINRAGLRKWRLLDGNQAIIGKPPVQPGPLLRFH